MAQTAKGIARNARRRITLRQSCFDARRCKRHAPDADPDGIEDRVVDGRGRWTRRRFSGSGWRVFRMIQQDHFQLGNIRPARHRISVPVHAGHMAVIEGDFFLQRAAQVDWTRFAWMVPRKASGLTMSPQSWAQTRVSHAHGAGVPVRLPLRRWSQHKFRRAGRVRCRGRRRYFQNRGDFFGDGRVSQLACLAAAVERCFRSRVIDIPQPEFDWIDPCGRRNLVHERFAREGARGPLGSRRCVVRIGDEETYSGAMMWPTDRTLRTRRDKCRRPSRRIRCRPLCSACPINCAASIFPAVLACGRISVPEKARDSSCDRADPRPARREPP